MPQGLFIPRGRWRPLWSDNNRFQGVSLNLFFGQLSSSTSRLPHHCSLTLSACPSPAGCLSLSQCPLPGLSQSDFIRLNQSRELSMPRFLRFFGEKVHFTIKLLHVR